MTEEIVELEREDGAARDGIREDDARLPAWYTWSFVGTVLFALVYVPYYLFSGWSAQGQWAAVVAYQPQTPDPQSEGLSAVQPEPGKEQETHYQHVDAVEKIGTVDGLAAVQ